MKRDIVKISHRASPGLKDLLVSLIPANLAAVPDLDDLDYPEVVIDRIIDPVIPLPYPITLAALLTKS